MVESIHMYQIKSLRVRRRYGRSVAVLRKYIALVYVINTFNSCQGCSPIINQNDAGGKPEFQIMSAEKVQSIAPEFEGYRCL